MENDDDDIVLSEHARLALQAFLEEKSLAESNTEDTFVEEDWELSQFWYDAETSLTLAKSAIECVGNTGRIACVSCPSIYNQLRLITSEASENYLFEYDKRFQDKFSEHAIFYDYKDPLNVNEKFKSYFDIVLADPPYLSTECLEKFVETIHFLTDKKIVICTGAIMEECVKKLLKLRTCNFKPQHERKLGNEFKCYANFDLDQFIAKVKSTSDVNG